MKRRWVIVAIISMALIGVGLLVRTVRKNRQLANRAAATASGGSRETRRRSSRWARCITTARECPRTMSRLCAGTANLPSRATPTPSTPSLTCITTGKDCHWTIQKPHAGAKELPNKATCWLRTLSASSIARGEGVPPDNAEAVRWYRKSAEQGYPQAQYDLGYMYYYGYDVQRDRNQAYDLFQKAAARGNEDAKRALEWFQYGDWNRPRRGP